MPLDAAQPGELREDDDFTIALYRAAIGPVHTEYYLTLFSNWESTSRWKPHWNSAAGGWTLGWMAFRKMGGAALAYLGALVGSLLLLFGIGRLFFDLSETGQITMFLLWLLLAVLVPGLWGNVWFHSHCRKRMAVALAAHTDVAQSCAALARHSSQPRRAWVVGGVQLSLLVALGLVALQFSALAQNAGLGLSAAKPSTPQMASGKVKQIPSVAASAPVAVSAPAVASTPVVASAPAAVVVAAAPTPSVKPAKVPAALVATKPPPAPAAAPKAAVGRYGVNVGLFAKAANAESAQAKLKAAQLPTQVDTLKMKRGPRTRIRVGPFTTQAQADEAAIQVRALGLDALTYQD